MNTLYPGIVSILFVQRSWLPHERWCEVLGHVEFALNTTSAQGTSLSPAELVFGCKLHHPVDIVLGTPVV